MESLHRAGQHFVGIIQLCKHVAVQVEVDSIGLTQWLLLAGQAESRTSLNLLHP